jgi:antitoxin component of RelBE/YafQ-DinJ toxin-antitoxin module
MTNVKKQATTVTVQIRMTPAEKREFTAAAKALGLSLSAWLRMVAHGGKR